MSAPVTDRARAAATRSRTATIPAQRGASAQPYPGRGASEPAGGRRSAQNAARTKAYARRDDRTRRSAGGRQVRTAAPSGRPQFVLLIMVLLAVGLVATLWLSTAAAADSYRLKDATAEAQALSSQAERLHREVAVLASAPEVARRAAALGMVPVQDPARLVVAPDGDVSVVGEPRAAVAAPPPVPPVQPGQATPPAPGQPEAPAEGTTPDGDGDGDGDAVLAAPQAGGEPGTATGQDDSGTRADGAGETGGQDRGDGPAEGTTSSGSASSGSDGGGTDAG